MSVPVVITPETLSRVALAEALADAIRDVERLKRRLQAATELRLSPRERRDYIAPIQAELEIAEARVVEANQAITDADRAASDERTRALKEA